MNPADTEGGSSAQANDPASFADVSIPKHRFDEVSAELRRVRDELAIKDKLYLEERQRIMQAQDAQQNREVEITAEETGLDPQTHQAVVKTAKAIAARERQALQSQLGYLANRTEKAEFLAARGADKAKYLPQIEAAQRDHFQRTGTFMPADTVFDIIRSKELEERNRHLEQQLARMSQPGDTQTNPPSSRSDGSQSSQHTSQSTSSLAQPGSSGSYPNPDGTRQIPGGAPRGSVGGQASKNFSELSYEEMEAKLEEEFSAGQRL